MSEMKIFFGAGIFFLFLSVIGFLGRTGEWRHGAKTTAKILSSERRSGRQGKSTALEIEYLVDGVKWHRSLLVKMSDLEISLDAATIEVIYMPDDPGNVSAEAVVKDRELALWLAVVIGLVLTAIGGGAIYWGKRTDAKQGSEPKGGRTDSPVP